MNRDWTPEISQQEGQNIQRANGPEYPSPAREGALELMGYAVQDKVGNLIASDNHSAKHRSKNQILGMVLSYLVIVTAHVLEGALR